MRTSYTRKARLAAAVITAAATALVGTATSAHAEPAAAKQYTPHVYTAADARAEAAGTSTLAAATVWFQFKNANSGQVMAVSNSSDANGAPVIQWGERYQSNGLPNVEQAWTKVPAGTSSNWRNAGTNPWKSLAIGGGSKTLGAAAIQWTTYSSDHLEQQWKLIQSADGQTWEIQNINSKLCLAIGGASTTPGAAVIQWNCKMQPEQRWILTYWS